MTKITLNNGDVYQGVSESGLVANSEGLESITITVKEPFISKRYKNSDNTIIEGVYTKCGVKRVSYASTDAYYSPQKDFVKKTFYKNTIKSIETIKKE